MQDHITVPATKNSEFIVSLHDSWIDISQPGSFLVGRTPPIVQFKDTNLQQALESLLNYVRSYFTSDELFNTILDLECETVKTGQLF